MKRLAIITARSGSKGIKNKNIIDLCGKPLMAYSIEAAVKSGLFHRIIVSTDSKEYGSIAEKFGAEAMYRSEELASDTASSFVVIEDVLKRVEQDYDYFVLLQPTSPLRNEKHIIEAVESFEKRITDFDFLVSLKPSECHSSQIHPIDENGSLKYFVNDSGYRRQNFETEYTANGAIYIAKPNEYLLQKDFFGIRSMPYIMKPEDSVDIDNGLDYWFAKHLMLRRICMQMRD